MPSPDPHPGEAQSTAPAVLDDADRYDPTVPPPSPGAYELGGVSRLDVAFPSDGFRLAGHLYRPPDTQPAGDGRLAPAIVLDGPMPSIKELTLPVYAIHLARAGFAVLTFDRRGFGASEGVRQHFNPPDHVRDIRNATTYLLSRDDVNTEQVAAVGVCAGGGLVLQAGALDRRYRAVACIGAAYGARRPTLDQLGHSGWIDQMQSLAAGRLADLDAGQLVTHQALAPSSAPTGTALWQGDEAYDFYTSRQHDVAPSWVNELTQESIQNWVEYDAIGYAPLVAPTPLLVVHGTVDPPAPPRHAREVYATAGEPKSMAWIETTNHVQIYDIEPYVGQAAGALVDWLCGHMSAGSD